MHSELFTINFLFKGFDPINENPEPQTSIWFGDYIRSDDRTITIALAITLSVVLAASIIAASIYTARYYRRQKKGNSAAAVEDSAPSYLSSRIPEKNNSSLGFDSVNSKLSQASNNDISVTLVSS